MLRRIVVAAILAGAAAGLVVSAIQLAWVTPLILQAEVFEDAAGADVAAHHDDAAAPPHHHDATSGAWAPENGAERAAFTAVSNVLTGFGFALLLIAAVALSGRDVDSRRGLLWGLAGFAVFAAAPALGLPPELPGVDAGPVQPRQVWWLATAAATALGLGLMVFVRRWGAKAAAVVIVVLPHVIGFDLQVAPSLVPEDLIRSFVIASLISTAIFWIVLGGVSGFFYRKLG